MPLTLINASKDFKIQNYILKILGFVWFFAKLTTIYTAIECIFIFTFDYRKNSRRVFIP